MPLLAQQTSRSRKVFPRISYEEFSRQVIHTDLPDFSVRIPAVIYMACRETENCNMDT